MEAVGHNQRSHSEAIARRAKRGFSLIEAAIVLAVVGGVIGGIWVAAATVMENHRVEKTISATMNLIVTVRETNSGFTPNQLADSVAVNMSVDILPYFYDKDPILRDAFPRFVPSANPFIFSEAKGLWGGESLISLAARKRTSIIGDYEIVLFVPRRSCTKVANELKKIKNNNISSLKMWGAFEVKDMDISLMQLACLNFAGNGEMFKFTFQP